VVYLACLFTHSRGIHFLTLSTGYSRFLVAAGHTSLMHALTFHSFSLVG
jgi:hypothetical protein